MTAALKIKLAIAATVLALGLAVVALVLFGVGPFASVTATKVAGAPSARDAAVDFSTVYLRSLDGEAVRIPFPYSTVAVSKAASQTKIPTSARSGKITLDSDGQSTQRGSTATISMVGSDAAKHYPFYVDVTRTSRGWIVSGVVPPDMTEIDPKPRPQPKPTGPMRTAAQRIATGLVAHARVTGLKLGMPSGNEDMVAARLLVGNSTRYVGFLMHTVAGRWVLWTRLSQAGW